MSSPEPAPKQTRQDSTRQAAVPAKSPDQTTATGASASAVEANGQAGDAATGRMVADDSNHDGAWAAAWHGFTDGGQIALEIAKLLLFNPFTGSWSGNLEIGKALYYAQAFAPASALSMVTLHGANRGSNPVHVDLNLYHKTFDLTAAALSVAGFHTGTASGKTADLDGLSVHVQKGEVDLKIGSAIVHDVVFTRGAEHLHADELELHGLSASGAQGADLAANLHFAEAHVTRIVYGNAAPISFNLPAGASIDAVWTSHQSTPVAAAGGAAPAPATAHGTAAPGATAAAAPSLDVLPPGASVNVVIGKSTTHAAIAGQISGTTDIDHITAILSGKNGAPLAQLLITGFHGAGNATTSAANVSIDQVKLIGAPPLVNALLSNPGLAADEHVKSAVALVRSVGIKPSISGDVVFTHLGLAHGAAGDSATTDFASTLVLPNVGTLAVKMTKLSVGTANGASGSFDHFEATLFDPKQKQLGHVDLDGGAARDVDTTTRAGSVHKFHATGDVAGIVRAGDALVQQLPITVRSGFAMVRQLGITGDVSGSLTAHEIKGGGTEISGNFQAHVNAGDVGSVVIDVADFRGSASTASDATFRDFKTTLTNPRGHLIADVHIANGNFVEGAKGTTSFKAGKIDAKGDGPSVMAMVNAVVKDAPQLSPPVKIAFDLVRNYYVNGGGELALSGVAVTGDATGVNTAKLQNASASFKLATGESVSATATGVDTTTGAAHGTDVQFDSFTASLDAAIGGGHAKILVQRGGAKLGPPPKAGAAQDFTIRSHHATFDGQATDISKLVAGLRAHLGTLPAPVASVFEVVGNYASSQTGTQTDGKVDASVTADNLAVTEAHGQLSGTGDVSTRVSVPSGVANLTVHGFVGTGKDLKFSGLDLSVLDASGATAASLRVGATHLDASGAVTVASIAASGDGARLRTVVDALGNRVPAAVSQSLAAVGPSRVDAAITSISVAPTADGGLVSDAAVVRVTGAINVTAAGSKYRSPNAQLAIYGAHVTLGPDKKPREIDATSMDVTGTFSSLGNGRAIDGDATLHIGASKITLDAHGKVTGVQTANVVLAGDVTTKAAPASATAAPTAPTATTTAAATTAVAAAPAAAHASSGIDPAEQSEIVTGAQAIKSADIKAQTPIIAGRYGAGLVHVDVPAGATIYTSIQVRDYALTNGTRVQIQPKLEAFWIKAGGVDLETSGTQGVLEAKLSGFFDQNITKYVVGQKKLQLDLGALVQQVMGNMHKTLSSAAQAAAPSPAPAKQSAQPTAASQQRGTDALQKQHDKWAAKAAKDTTAKQRARDAELEPRSLDVADLATKGIEAALTSGTADIDLATRQGAADTIDAHLHGQAQGGTSGGVLELGASEAHVQVAGQTVDAKGVDTGPVDLTQSNGATHVQISRFSIETLQWLGS